MEPISAYFVTIGAIALFLSWIVLIIRSSKEDFAWGLCSVLLPPVAYGFGLLRLDVAKEAMSLAVIGLVFLAIGIS